MRKRTGLAVIAFLFAVVLMICGTAVAQQPRRGQAAAASAPVSVANEPAASRAATEPDDVARARMAQEIEERRNYARERSRTDILAFMVFIIMVGFTLQLIHTVVQNRQRNRAAQIQAEMHSKLLDKFSSSQELLAYMETDAGRRFLEAIPVDTDRAAASPYARILWSAQVGLVVTLLGLSLMAMAHRVPDAVQPLFILGGIGIALGIGLLLSAALSYRLSRSLGLIGPRNESEDFASQGRR